MDERPDRKNGGGRDPGLQRVRVGVTGLAAVFLLTLLAASLFTLLGPDTRNTGHPAGHGLSNSAEDMPKEPLAELGVAPGNAPKNPVPVANAPAPAHPQPATHP